MALWIALSLPLFGIAPPLAASVALSQIAHLAHALPIAAFGIGVDQLTFPALFGAWEPASQPGSALAFSVAFTAAMIVSRGALGLVLLPGVLARLRERPPGDP